MSRVWLLLLLGCAHGVSRPNEVPPPGAPYAGRIVVSTSALREQVDDFAGVWARRLAILGANARITYDDARAVFDVYGLGEHTLDDTAHALTDRGGWWLDDQPVDGFAVAWLPPTATCACSARVRITLSSAWMCRMTDGMHRLARGDRATPLLGRVRWMAKMSDGVAEIDRPSSLEKCPSEAAFPDSVMFALPPDLSPAAQTEFVLGLAGGNLPAAPRVVEVRR